MIVPTHVGLRTPIYKTWNMLEEWEDRALVVLGSEGMSLPRPLTKPASYTPAVRRAFTLLRLITVYVILRCAYG